MERVSMNSFTYNDIEFSIEAAGQAWDVLRSSPAGTRAVVGAGLFGGLNATEAAARAQALVRSIYPVGVRIIGPDVTHPAMVGDLRLVGPSVAHPNFVYWDHDSVSFPQQG
jgi:hypothetical protein